MEARAIVEVRYGLMQGKKAVIARGARLRVGRTEFSDLVVSHDGQMSGEHFELSWDGERCFVKDLESLKGTRLGGELVTEAEVGHGGWIRAGATDFLVHIEGKIPPQNEEEDGEEEPEFDDETRELWAVERATRHDAKGNALAALKAVAAKQKLYAVLDAARRERILQLLRQNVEEHRSLYEGVEGETMADVAPYLVGPMKESSLLLEALVLEGWGKRWGIYCTSEIEFKEVRRHFRRFLMVEDEETEERLYLRFYDPAVMRVFLPSCTERQRDEFMDELDALWVEGEGMNLVRASPLSTGFLPC